MQFKVPQNIDLEDRIVGPLTLIQFLYLIGGGLLVYVLYQAIGLSSLAAFLILAIPLAALALSLAFLKIQDRPLSHFILAGLTFLGRPKLRLWQRTGEEYAVFTEPPAVKKEATNIEKKSLGKSELEMLAQTLDTQPLNDKESRGFGQATKILEKILSEEQVPKKG